MSWGGLSPERRPQPRAKAVRADYTFITPTDIPDDARYIETARGLSERPGFQRNLLLLVRPCVSCALVHDRQAVLTRTVSFTNQQINAIVV